MTRGRCAIRAMPSGRSRVSALAVALVPSFQTRTDALADEGGISLWLPGLFGSLAAAPQVPGWAVGIVYYHSSISAEGSVVAAREVTIGKLNPTINVNLDLNLKAGADLVVIDPSTRSRLRCVRWSVQRQCGWYCWTDNRRDQRNIDRQCGPSSRHVRAASVIRRRWRSPSANVAAVELGR